MMDETPISELIAKFQTNQIAVGRAKGTRDRYKYTFLIFTRFIEETGVETGVAVLNSGTMDKFATWLRATPINPQHGTDRRMESGIHAHLCDMRAFCRWLYREELIPKDIRFPMPKVPKRLFKILDDSEMQRVWKSKFLTGNSSLAIRNRALLALMLDTGLRRSEVASLTLENISMEKRTITVIGKGNKERRVFFSVQVRDYLKSFLAIRGIDDEPLFHLSSSSILSMFTRIKDEVGLERFHPHLLRHQFATMMIRETKNMEYVRLLLGHEDYNTTKRYLSLADEDLQEAHESGSPFDKMIGKTDLPEPQRRRQRYSRHSA
jgi:site-specific recombinase XerD